MKIHLLGTGGYHPNARRHTTCVLLPEAGIAFDAGSAFFRVADLLKTPRLDIFMTHAHLDHSMGLTFYFTATYNTALNTIVVHGEAEKLQTIRDHLFSPLIFPVVPPLVWQRLEDSFALAEGGMLRWFPLEHPGGSLGYRIDWPGKSLAFITDTTASLTAPYVEFIRGVDLLIHECNFPAGHDDLAQRTGHSCMPQVAAVAAAADVGRLVLTHVDPSLLDDDPLDLPTARSLFANTQLAYDGMVLEL